ncbi:Ataxin-3 [Gonapodya sp. JEL0774]|nr:Ataxin-3 [Gonapodya sp. JEL0774]
MPPTNACDMNLGRITLHALNSLLQGAYFSAVDLATIAQELDRRERAALRESGATDEDVAAFEGGGSNNYDDSGFFSVQVIEEALQVWGLSLLPIDAREIRDAPNHDPLFSAPTWISPTYLSLFLAQLREEGYSMWPIRGAIPPCEADAVADTLPQPDPGVEAALATSANPSKSSLPTKKSRTLAVEDAEYERAVAASLAAHGSMQFDMDVDPAEDPELAAALRMSLGSAPGFASSGGSSSSNPAATDDDESLRAALKASLEDGGAESKSVQRALEESRKAAGLPPHLDGANLAVAGTALRKRTGRDDEEEALAAALKASLDEASAPAQASAPPEARLTVTASDPPVQDSPVVAAPVGSSRAGHAPTVPPSEVSSDEMRRRRLERFASSAPR